MKKQVHCILQACRLGNSRFGVEYVLAHHAVEQAGLQHPRQFDFARVNRWWQGRPLLWLQQAVAHFYANGGQNLVLHNALHVTPVEVKVSERCEKINTQPLLIVGALHIPSIKPDQAVLQFGLAIRQFVQPVVTLLFQKNRVQYRLYQPIAASRIC